MNQIDESTWCGYHDMRPLVHRDHLRHHVHASNHDCGSDVEWCSDDVELIGYLERKFPIVQNTEVVRRCLIAGVE